MSTFNRDIWQSIEIKPAPALASLRDTVIERSEKRSPKWRFRLAHDLVVRIQPKLTARDLHRFECLAVSCEGADGAVLAESARKKMAGQYIMLGFDLTVATADAPWKMKAKSIRWGKPRPDEAGVFSVRDRLAAAFEAGQFNVLSPAMMLGNFCLYCGKALTDPVSQARMIGPECAGTSSVYIPGVRDLQLQLPEQPAAAVDISEHESDRPHDYRALLRYQMEIDETLERAIDALREFDPQVRAAFLAALDGIPFDGFEERLFAAVEALPEDDRIYFLTVWDADADDGEDEDIVATAATELQIDSVIEKNPVLARFTRDEISDLIKQGILRA